MRISSKFVIGLLAILLLVLPLLVACDDDETAEPTETAQPTKTTTQPTKTTTEPVTEPVEITLAFMGDFTGPYAAYSPPVSQGMEDYAWYVNEKIGGIDGGKVKIKYVWKDTANDVSQIISSYEDLKKEDASIIYMFSTTMVQTLAARINEDGIPAVSQGPAQAALDPPGSIYMRYPFYPDMFGLFLDWYLEEWDGPEPPKFAILTTDFPLGHEMLTEDIENYLASKGVELVATELVDVVPVDVTPQLTRIKNSGADFCFGNNLAVTSSAILKGMVEMGLADSLDYGCPTTGIAEDVLAILKDSPEVAEGFLYTRAFAAWEETDNPTIKLINETYQERHGKTPPYSETYLIGWNVMSTMVEAVRLALEEVAPEDLTPAAIDENGFRQMKDFSPGVYGGNGGGEGLMNFAEFGNAGAAYLRIAKVTDGKVEILTDWRKVPNITGLPGY